MESMEGMNVEATQPMMGWLRLWLLVQLRPLRLWLCRREGLWLE